MTQHPIQLGIVTDEISRELDIALDQAAAWGIRHFELREGSKQRFPLFTAEEIGRIDTLVSNGGTVTAVSPGIYKGHVEDRAQWRQEADSVFPKTIELAQRFECTTIIAFGFESCDERPENRLQVLNAFERIAEQAAEARMQVAIENEPGFWIDRPRFTLSMLEEIGHPALKLNWDPANLHWGGQVPDEEAVTQLKEYIVNLHVKDFTPEDEEVPWRALGEGVVPWATLFPIILEHLRLSHVTIETHCEPLIKNSRISLDFLLDLIARQ